MENMERNFGELYMAYDLYAKSCERHNKVPVGFVTYLCKCLTGAEF